MPCWGECLEHFYTLDGGVSMWIIYLGSKLTFYILRPVSVEVP
jgi:hypothetical protein